MNKITPELVQKFEFYSIFINNILLLLGVTLFGWTLFETLFLYWLEPLAALLVINYLVTIVPLKYGRPGLGHLPEYRIPALKTIGLSIYTLIMHYIALVFIINLCKVDGWDTSLGIFYTLSQMPAQLWNGSLFLLTIVFLLAYLMPPLLLERRGIKPSLEAMPMQTKIMIHPSQFIVNYLWFGILWLVHKFDISSDPIVLIAILMVLKSVYEAFLFFRIQKASFL